MPVVEFKDKGGETITYMEVDGVFYPNVGGEETIRETLQTAQGKEGDILLLNYPKSGTHWLWEILCMMVRGNTDTIPKIKQSHFLEALSKEELSDLPSPRVLNSHLRFHSVSEDFKRRRAKVVLIHRNPKDVAVSLYNHEKNLPGLYGGYNGTWENWFPMFLEGTVSSNSWFDYVLDWERAMRENPDYPVHLLFYENLKANGPTEIQRLATFLELPLTGEMCQAIAKKCGFDNMKADKVGLENEFWINVWRDKKPGFYRKGEVGDWKNWFTVAQNEAMDAMFAEKMKASKLEFKFDI